MDGLRDEVGTPVWVVYDHPEAHPDSYFAELYLVTKSGLSEPLGETITSAHLRLIEAILEDQMGLSMLNRDLVKGDKVIGNWT